MEEINVVLKEYVQLRLAAAPESMAKSELIEELTENLCCRYADLIAGGMDAQQAKDRAMDSLGETDELVEYLSQLPPDEPLPEPISEMSEENIQLDALWKNVEGIIRGVAQKAKHIARTAKETVEESGVLNCKAEEPAAHEKPADKSWEFSMGRDEEGKFYAESGKGENRSRTFEVDSDEIKAVVKDAMKEVKQAMKGAGHVMREAMDTAGDAVRDAYEEVKSELNDRETPVEVSGPIEGGTLTGIEVRTGSGDITIRFSQNADSDVLVGGDIEDLEVFRSDSGVLTIRPVQTAASAFFFGRGILGSANSADVVLDLPARYWNFLRINTSSGDIEMEGNVSVGLVEIRTQSGDVEGNVAHCDLLDCKTTSGDINWWGEAQDLHMETVSGDLDFQGRADRSWMRSISGELGLRGAVGEAQAKTVSGEVTIHSNRLPDAMDVTTTSGEIAVRLPDDGPFKVNLRTVSGGFHSNFFAGTVTGRETNFIYESGGDRLYRFSTVSGGVTLKKY